MWRTTAVLGRSSVSPPSPVYEQRVLNLKLKNAEVSEPSGRKLGGEEVWQRLAIGATVVIPVDGKSVDSAYLPGQRHFRQ